MKKNADFLVEILTEELPPKALQKLADAFLQRVTERLRKLEISFDDSQFFATPRRLAVFIKNLAPKQNDTVVERKGPALEAAFNAKGEPTPACAGFAKSCSVTPKALIQIETPQGKWVGFKQKIAGKKIQELMPDIVQQSLASLPIPKRMRWGNNSVEFVRPVHGVVMLYGDKIINATILGCKTTRKTQGHRFLSKGLIEIKKPADYASVLEKKGHVIADFSLRKKRIEEKAKKITKHEVIITEELVNEVTGLVEWPVAIFGNFDKNFLDVPQEVLISAMQDHQRYFPVMNKEKKILPHFVAISNIESKDTKKVVAGNERVLRARLADAAFFYTNDQKISLNGRLDKLKQIVFQAKLGTLFDKSERLAKLAALIAKEIKLDEANVIRAALLTKTDLTTELVGEFPELQGIAGYYYALRAGESNEVAAAINEHYMPRFSGDQLPSTMLGAALAIADRLDTLVGLFGINQPPTGDKDPFGLRRAALGVLRILIEKKLNVDLEKLVKFALSNYQTPLENKNVVRDVLNFIQERLKPWYQEQGILPDVFAAVAALNITSPYDFHCRIQAVQTFKKMTEAESLSIANKRVSNILTKYTNKIAANNIDEKLFEHDAERVLSIKLKEQQKQIVNLSRSAQYQEVLAHLAHLRKPVDDFFDKVLVMTDDKARRENRLLLLKKLRELFLHVADIALLQ